MADGDDAIQIDSAQESDDWLTTNGSSEREIWIAIYTKASGKQTVSFDTLLELGFCRG